MFHWIIQIGADPGVEKDQRSISFHPGFDHPPTVSKRYKGFIDGVRKKALITRK